VNNLISLAQMYYDKKEFDRSLTYARMADTISRTLKYNGGRVRSLAHIAFVYAGRGNWPKSFVTVDEAWPLAQKAYPQQLPFLCSIMFMNYAFKGDLNTAMSWGFKSLNESVFQTLPDEGKWPTYVQLANGYAVVDRLDSAEYYASFLKTYISKKLNPPGMLENSYRVLGFIATKKKNYEEAIDYYGRDTANATGMAQVYEELKQPDSAIHYAKIGLDYAIRMDFPIDVITNSSILARLYHESNPKLAYNYLQTCTAAKDTLYNANRAKGAEERSLAQQKEQFQKQSQAATFQNRIIQISLLALAAVFLVSSVLFFRSNRVKRTANRKLEKAYAELKATQTQLIQSEKMASLGELTAGIAHEIQNPLNFVNNFSDVNKELLSEMKVEMDKGNLEDARVIANDVIDNEEKISHHGKRADAIVKGMLQHSRTSSGQKEPTDINKLADEYLRLAYQGFRAKDKSFNATIVSEFDQNISSVNIIPQEIGRVILNLINNAFYAVNEKQKQNLNGYEPTVTVSTKRNTGMVAILVRDNGNGIPQKVLDKIFQPFFTTKPTGQGTGLGLSLAYDIVKAHGGEIKVETKEGEGSEFIVLIPVNNRN